MAPEALSTLLESGKGGVYFIPPTPVKTVQSAAKSAGLRCFHIEGKSIERKEQMLNAVATALQMPPHFGHNWDALEEGLIDIDDDAPGYLIYYDHIDPLLAAHPDQFQTFIEVCRDAVATWKADDTPMVVLCSGTKAPKGLPRLK